MRRKKSRVPFALVPTIALLLGALFLAVKGFRPRPFAGASGASTAAADNRAQEWLDQSFQAIRVGDNRNAQQFMIAAVDERAASMTPGRAYASVADDLLSHGYATQAVTLLDLATRDPAASWSPAVWAALARACTSAGDKTGSESASAQAQTAARTIMESAIPPANASEGSKQAAAAQFLDLGAYEVEYSRDPREALPPYRKALALLPRDPQTMETLGRLLADVGTSQADFEEAVKLTRTAAQQMPDAPGYLDAYGWALLKRGNLVGAQQVLTQAVIANTTQPEIHYHLGQLFLQLGQNDDALREFTRALLLRPDYPDAARAKTRLDSVAKASPAAAAGLQTPSEPSAPSIQARP